MDECVVAGGTVALCMRSNRTGTGDSWEYQDFNARNEKPIRIRAAGTKSSWSLTEVDADTLQRFEQKLQFPLSRQVVLPVAMRTSVSTEYIYKLSVVTC